MRHLPPLLLALAACSSDPAPPVDSGPLDTGPADTGADALITHDWLFIDAGEDRPALVDVGSDAGALDAGADVGADTSIGSDAADCATDVVSCRCPDGTESSHDVCLTEWCNCFGHEGAPDAGADAAMDAGGADARDVDVAADRPDVVDVLRDTGPVDGGPVVYDLDAARSSESFRVIYRLTIPGGGGGVEDCDTPARSTSCSVMGDALRFSLEACGVTFTGLLPLSSTSGRIVSIFGGAPDTASSINPPLSAGRVAGGRQSFRVQIVNTSTPRMIGVAGISGRTVDPLLGDFWLLGCRVN